MHTQLTQTLLITLTSLEMCLCKNAGNSVNLVHNLQVSLSEDGSENETQRACCWFLIKFIGVRI